MRLLERAEPLAALEQALTEARGGHGLVVLVGGEAGVGKTSLVREFAQRRADGVPVLVGACDALSTPRPLGPIVDIAAALQDDLARTIVGGRPGDIFAALYAEL
jgi:predicted ATPase